MSRRLWAADGRAYIEVRGADEPDSEGFARHLEVALQHLDGVHLAEVNAILGRVVVAFDDDTTSVDRIIDAIEGVETLHGKHTLGFPHDRPEHPGDVEPLRRQLIAIGADILGAGVSTLRRALRMPGLPEDIGLLLTLVDSTPRIRHEVESRLGNAAADLALAVTSAATQGLSLGPLGLLVDAAHRTGLAAEATGRREVWRRREPELHALRGTPSVPLAAAQRVQPLPPGPVDRYADEAGVATLLGFGGMLAASADHKRALTVLADGAPKAAKMAKESFAAWLGVSLCRHGVVPLDGSVLRRLDRIDTVVLDARALLTGRYLVHDVCDPGGDALDPTLERTVREQFAVLFDHQDPRALRARGRWGMGPLTKLAAGDTAGRVVARRLSHPGGVTLGLSRGGRVVAVIAVIAEVDQLAAQLVASARGVGHVVIAGATSGLGTRLGVDSVVAGGTHLATELRRLQHDGRVVALVTTHGDAALRTADCGIGILAESLSVPWGAHLLCGPGLAQGLRILDAVAAARATSRRGSQIALGGSVAGGILALAGPARGATGRALLAVNGAAAAGIAVGAWSVSGLSRRADPIPVEAPDWHAMEGAEVLKSLDAGPEGLAQEHAEAKLAKRPPTAQYDEVGLGRATVDELTNPLTPVLAAGAAVSAASGSVTDAVLISGVAAVNALLGGLQRVRATRAMGRLFRASATRVRVLRDDREVETDADQIVPGDIVHYGPGDAVAGDARILEAADLEMDESSLTGESQLVPKAVEPVVAASVADRHNMLYEGTVVGAGRATAVVVATGTETEYGRTAAEASRDQTRPDGAGDRLRRWTKATIPVALGAGAALFGAGALRGRSVRDALGTGVGLAVAAVPEGLPLVATVGKLAAAQRLSRSNVLVRNPATMETLGRVDVLCFDKTGTLTEGRIRLQRVSDGAVDMPIDSLDRSGRLVLAAGLRASPPKTERELPHPTDRAVLAAADAAGVQPGEGQPRWRLVDEVPFESARGYHAVLGATRNGQVVSVKGAPEVILQLCTAWRRDGSTQPLDPTARSEIDAEINRLAMHGYRLLAVAERAASRRVDLDEDRVADLSFLGLLAFADPVRATSAHAVKGLHKGGVRIVMATGDHPSTAESIAAELGILADGAVLTGADVDTMDDHELTELLPKISVFARVTPTHKVRIVRALQQAGHTVAMTGDGANDAAAIRLADVGVALGDRGTDAAREAADLVVVDDGIESIIDALVEARAMWSSVRDAVSVLVGGNLGEIGFTLGTGLLAPGGSPLNARQLMLVNLLTDMLPSMALAMRAPGRLDPDALMREGPDTSLGTALTSDVIIRAGATAASTTGAWLIARSTGTSAHASTVALATLVGTQLGQTMLAGYRSPLVVAAALGSAGALSTIIQTPGLSHFFGCRPLGPLGWSTAITASAIGTGASAAAAALASRRLRSDNPPF
jgi:cation-transporting ATPase I